MLRCRLGFHAFDDYARNRIQLYTAPWHELSAVRVQRTYRRCKRCGKEHHESVTIKEA